MCLWGRTLLGNYGEKGVCRLVSSFIVNRQQEEKRLSPMKKRNRKKEEEAGSGTWGRLQIYFGG